MKLTVVGFVFGILLISYAGITDTKYPSIEKWNLQCLNNGQKKEQESFNLYQKTDVQVYWHFDKDECLTHKEHRTTWWMYLLGFFFSLLSGIGHIYLWTLRREDKNKDLERKHKENMTVIKV